MTDKSAAAAVEGGMIKGREMGWLNSRGLGGALRLVRKGLVLTGDREAKAAAKPSTGFVSILQGPRGDRAVRLGELFGDLGRFSFSLSGEGERLSCRMTKAALSGDA